MDFRQKSRPSFLVLVAALCATICLTGCFTLDTADIHTTGEEHICVGNSGWYLFNFIPLACGNASEDPMMPWVFFRNDVDETKLQDRFTGYASAIGCDVDDLVMFNSEQVLLDIYSIPVPIPYICCYREMQISGVLVKRPTAAEAAAARAEAMKREMKELLKKVPVEEGK